MPKHRLKGSERKPMYGATLIGNANPAERLEVSVILVSKDAAGLRAKVAGMAGGVPAGGHLTQAE
jgi:kumamolisin